MKNLLENDLPAYYRVGRRCVCDEIVTLRPEFDLIDNEDNWVVDYRTGYASFCNNISSLSVIDYEKYIGKYAGTQMSDGKRRCDFILTDKDGDNLVVLCEITSTIGGVENLSLPITRTKNDGSVETIFPKGKYQKVELQLYQSLENLIQVPSVCEYLANKRKKICLMSYLIKPAEDKAVDAFNRNRMVEAEEAGEDGAHISFPQVERYGFEYYRISHQYPYKLY